VNFSNMAEGTETVIYFNPTLFYTKSFLFVTVG
jgi:hypothetical protein